MESRFETTNRIYRTLADVLDIVVLLIRIFTEFFVAIIQSIGGKKPKDVSGEIVLITGTGHGIGRELALQYTALGSTVVCVDINEQGNSETVKEANSLGMGEAHAYYCDVSNRDKVLELAEKVQREVGTVSILVNNAGIMPTHRLEQHSSAEIQKIFDVNVFAHFWTIEAFLPGMKQQNRGYIVALSSIAGLVGLANLVPYCASKFAVQGMMEALHEEYREQGITNIKITVVSPYMVNTGLCKKPKVKFPSILGLLDPHNVASVIIDAQRKEVKEMTIPRGLLPFGYFCRLLPTKCTLLIKDFIDSGVESDM